MCSWFFNDEIAEIIVFCLDVQPLYMLNDFNGQKLDSFSYNFWVHFWTNFL